MTISIQTSSWVFNYHLWRDYSKHLYIISQLQHALWLVNLASRTLLYGPFKFKISFVAKLFCDLSPPTVLNFYSK